MELFLQERLLQFIWQHQYFDRQAITSTGGEAIQIQNPGTINRNQGPDFENARIRIGQTDWAGKVELHVRSSDWDRHGHASDPQYNNVILHVVWEEDRRVNDIPVLELQGRVPGLLLQHYERLMHQSAFIACEDIYQPLPDLVWTAWRERLLTERLLRRMQEMEPLLQQTKFDWEQLCWRMLARNFGMRLNADAFDDMARSLPLTLIARHRPDRFQLEALLMGQAGLLKGPFHDHYPRSLQKEYKALARKYNLSPISIPCVYLRMRPVNFPGIRLSQLAALLQKQDRLFAAIRDSASVKDIRELASVSASQYWETHFRFDEPAAASPRQTGDMLTDSVVINTAIPLLFAYAHTRNDQRLLEKALHWFGELRPEKNHIVMAYQQLGLPAESSADSQALLELKKHYCEAHRCLECAIGNFLLKAPG